MDLFKEGSCTFKRQMMFLSHHHDPSCRRRLRNTCTGRTARSSGCRQTDRLHRDRQTGYTEIDSSLQLCNSQTVNSLSVLPRPVCLSAACLSLRSLSVPLLLCSLNACLSLCSSDLCDPPERAALPHDERMAWCTDDTVIVQMEGAPTCRLGSAAVV